MLRLENLAQDEEKEKKKDPVDEAGEESFPASDPPSWNAGVDKPKTEGDDNKMDNQN